MRAFIDSQDLFFETSDVNPYAGEVHSPAGAGTVAHTSKRKNIDYIQIFTVYIHTHSIITCTYKANMHL